MAISNTSENKYCLNCGSDNIVKNGKYKKLQRYKCKTCKSTVTELVKEKEDDITTDIIRKALHLYIEGYSLALISKILNVNKSKVNRWMQKLGLEIENLRKKTYYKPVVLTIYTYSNKQSLIAFQDKQRTFLSIPLMNKERLYNGKLLPVDSTLVSDNPVINGEQNS